MVVTLRAGLARECAGVGAVERDVREDERGLRAEEEAKARGQRHVHTGADDRAEAEDIVRAGQVALVLRALSGDESAAEFDERRHLQRRERQVAEKRLELIGLTTLNVGGPVVERREVLVDQAQTEREVVVEEVADLTTDTEAGVVEPFADARRVGVPIQVAVVPGDAPTQEHIDGLARADDLCLCRGANEHRNGPDQERLEVRKAE